MTRSDGEQRGHVGGEHAFASTSGPVGRVRETAMLRDAVLDMLAGRGRLVMLAGEPGIGKTRLAEETALDATARGARVLWGRCWEGGGAPAFWPWIQVIRGSLGGAVSLEAVSAEVRHALAHIAQVVPELRSTLPGTDPMRESGAEMSLSDAARGPGPERFRLFDAVSNLLKWLAGQDPLMIVLDDLHAADDDSLALLRFVARELKQTRMLIVGTYREIEVRQSDAHATLLAEIGREGTTVPLRGLSLEEVADFVRRLCKVPVDHEMVSTLQKTTDGNPFFLDEIVRLINADRDPVSAQRPVVAFTIPDSIRTAIRRRLRPLAEPTRSLLTYAAVIGREFDLTLLQEAAGVGREQVVGALAEAVAHAIVLEADGPADRYRFTHAIIVEVLRVDLGRTRRAQLHQQVASAMERVHAAHLTPHLAQLAHHCFEALTIGGPAKALDYARRGAESAANQLAFAEAARLYGVALRALEAVPQPDDVQRCQTLLVMGEAQARGGSLDEARRAFEQAAVIARTLDRSSLLARCALHVSAWFGTFFTLDRALVALLLEALAAVGEGDSAVRATLLASLASERHWGGEREVGLALSDEAVAMAQRLDDPRALVSALWMRCQIRWGPENVEGRLASATEIASLAESIGDHQRALRAHEMRFTALLEMGDMPGVAAEMRAYEALARQAGEQFGIVERFHAALALLRGDFDQAHRQAQELSRHAQRRQDLALLTCAQALSAALAEEQGRLEPAQIALAAQTAIAQSPALAVQGQVIMALVQVVSGDRVEAAAHLERLAQDEYAAVPRDWNWLENMRCLSIVCLGLRDTRHAAILYDLLLPYADRNITTGWGDVARGAAALYLGSLAGLLGRLDEAQAHLEAALRFNERIGARPSVARTQFESARIALKRNQLGDRERAIGLLRESLATATALGMVPLEMRARALLARVGEPPAVGAPTQGGADAIEAIAAAAVAERADLAAHTAPDGTLTILFSDIERSSALFDELGDLRAHAILDAHNVIVRHHVGLQKGTEIKSTGDGFLVVFSSARRGLQCAIGIQRALAASSEQQGHPPVRVRIGLHVGEPIKVTTDIAGKAVIIAARIASTARGGEILVSSTLREVTDSAGDLAFEDAGEVELKGLSGRFRLYRVVW